MSAPAAEAASVEVDDAAAEVEDDVPLLVEVEVAVAVPEVDDFLVEEEEPVVVAAADLDVVDWAAMVVEAV